MLFLEKIDEIYSASRTQYSVSAQSDDFYVYIPIEISDSKYTYPFLIRKGNKSKLLITSGKQRVYLTDNQIIHTILSMEKTEIDWFLSQFISLYKGTGVQLTFNISDAIFTCVGICSFPEDKKLLLFSDTKISYSNFCFLLSFIFSKDACWEEISRITNFSKKTLCKYISIIDYYHNSSEHSRLFLSAIGCPLNNGQFSDSVLVSKAFEKIDCVEKFDISNYT